MYQSPKRRVAQYTDSAGRSVVQVRTKCGAIAELWAEDFKRVSAIYGANWHISRASPRRGYVCVWGGHTARCSNSTTVARLITGTYRRNERVCYRDGNRLNLRRENLQVVGRAKV